MKNGVKRERHRGAFYPRRNTGFGALEYRCQYHDGDLHGIVAGRRITPARRQVSPCRAELRSGALGVVGVNVDSQLTGQLLEEVALWDPVIGGQLRAQVSALRREAASYRIRLRNLETLMLDQPRPRRRSRNGKESD